MIEPITARRKRLVYRSRYRGVLESDLFFGRFADAHVAALTAEQLDRYEALLNENDHDLFAWISGRRPVPAEHDHDVFRMLKNFDVVSAR